VLLYWHELLEEIRVIPRVVHRSVETGTMIRIHPLAQDAEIEEEGRTTHVLSLLHIPACEAGCGAVRDFFAQWPGWIADANGFLALPGLEGALSVLMEVVPRFPPDWQVKLDRKLEHMQPKRVVVTTVCKLGDAADNHLLDFDVRFHCDQLHLTDDQLWAFIHGQQRWLVDGGDYVEIVNLDALRRLLNRMASHVSGEDGEERLALRNAQLVADMLAWADTQERESVRMEGDLRALLQDGDEKPLTFPLPDLPENLIKTLRPWQQTGVGWLTWMAAHHFGCVLADDMGLGKTLQALAYLRGAYGRNQQGRPSLLLCPKSLLYSWLTEARRFVPDLRVRLVHGSASERRRLLRDAMDMDLLITTYPLFLSDWEPYANMSFHAFLLDEAQLIRNPETRLSRHVRKIKASFRLAMTGTPLENSPMDLWAIFDFVLPGFLGTQSSFQARSRQGAEAWPDLVRQVRPFLLRRTKTEVLPELPERTDVDIPVALTQNQLALYEHTRAHIRAGVEQALVEQGSGTAWILLLAGLTRLRQICDHPGLVHTQWRTVHGASGKMEAFDTLIGQCLAGSHKVLVFSQFARMLELLEQHLCMRKIGCLRLDGQTRDRQPIIDRFNQDPDVSVFLISMKAGGFGLNLTAADTVILFDPWWNPMVEEQAADRVHRFGQKRPVTVYRLLTEETIETRMQQLKAKKRALFDAVVNGAAGDRKALLREELGALLG
jgi:SNF2 family DNA or RNA helicase